jgi:hypothetical protein
MDVDRRSFLTGGVACAGLAVLPEILILIVAPHGLQQKQEPSPREFECHLMVAQSLAALDQTEVPDQAVVAAAHSSQSASLNRSILRWTHH